MPLPAGAFSQWEAGRFYILFVHYFLCFLLEIIDQTKRFSIICSIVMPFFLKKHIRFEDYFCVYVNNYAVVLLCLLFLEIMKQIRLLY